MAWLELHTVLIRHRKVKKLARELSIKPVQAVGHLTTLWSNVLELAEDGDITKWSKEDIADYAGWEGDPQDFYKALLNDKDGWINEKEGKILIHDWFDYAGRYLKAKYKTFNPNRLNDIMALYGQTKDRLKTDFGQTTNQSINQSNQSINGGGFSDEDIKNLLLFYKDKQGWDKVGADFYKRNYLIAKTLLIEAKELKLAKEAIDWWADYSQKHALSWTLETVIKKWADFMKYHDMPEIERKWVKNEPRRA